MAAVKCKTCDIKGIALFVWFKNRVFTYASVTVIGFSVKRKEFELFMYKWHSVLITAYKFPLVHAINLFSRETIDKVCYVNSIKSTLSGGRRHHGKNWYLDITTNKNWNVFNRVCLVRRNSKGKRSRGKGKLPSKIDIFGHSRNLLTFGRVYIVKVLASWIPRGKVKSAFTERDNRHWRILLFK